MPFAVEIIPDTDKVYFRAHESYFQSGSWTPGVFKDHQGGMSVDWDRYSSARDTHSRCKDPVRNAIFEFSAGSVRGINNGKGNLTVIHEPIEEQANSTVGAIKANQSHSEIFGEKNAEARLKLSRVYAVAVPLGQLASAYRAPQKSRIDRIIGWFKTLFDRLSSS